MHTTTSPAHNLEFHPLSGERWPDLEALFGPNGASGGCWCMWWRLPRAEFDRQKGEGNRQLLKALADSGHAPGILAYAGGRPVGWCSIGPREEFVTLERSRVLARVDDEPVWSVVCFYVARGFRRQGIMAGLLGAAVAFARARGATIVEGYPIAPAGPLSSFSAYTGLASTFARAGFVEVARRSATRPIMRYVLR
ncbi:MAG: GNAT family N-acetyltransferase [Anaerolineae bacterium]|nr:GNAT family N-acetyltransferase [Anaerolineae bacterium]